MAQSKLKRMRLKQGEVRSIRPDLTAAAKLKDPNDSKAIVTLTEENRGVAIIMLPDDPEILSNLALGVLGAIRIASMPSTSPRSGEQGPHPEEIVRLVPIDRIQILKPEGLAAPVGHAVLEFHVGTVPLRFSAPAEMWKDVFVLFAVRVGVVVFLVIEIFRGQALHPFVPARLFAQFIA